MYWLPLPLEGVGGRTGRVNFKNGNLLYTPEKVISN